MTTGIITMFYNSTNYGGILQAYALVRTLEKLDIEAEQIRYNNFSAYSLVRRFKGKIVKYLPLIKNPIKLRYYWKIWKRSNMVKKAANKLVPHSKRIYTEKNIYRCITFYDSFITGSDQVWYGDWPAYFLPFVPAGKKKIAYAVSTGKTNLLPRDINMIESYTHDYTAISVRESDTAAILKKVLNDREISIALDPTMLLEKNDWENIASHRIIKDSYIFCYYLGSDIRMRRLATQYSTENNLTLVTIPHMQGTIENNDIDFGDIQSFEATSEDFLSYIKYADVIFTDSFHACVFSQMFQKQYFVFGRTEHKEMNNRIETLVNMFNVQRHFLQNIDNVSCAKLSAIPPIDYDRVPQYFNRLKNESIEFLKKNILNK